MLLKIGYTNMWKSFFEERKNNPPIWEKSLVRLGYKIQIVDPYTNYCDVVFRSVFNADNKTTIKGNPPIIEYSGESYLKGNYDYSISHVANSESNLYYPLFLLEEQNYYKAINKSFMNVPRNKFCGCLISNIKLASKWRRILFFAINMYKKIDSGGRYRNNIGRSIKNKSKFIQQYKFYFCTENYNRDGYITEKIIDAFSNGAIPIYYGGGKTIKKLFNSEAFICCNNLNLLQIIFKIRKIDKNDELYNQMLRQNPFANNNYLKLKTKELDNFLLQIVSKINNINE